MGQQCRAMQPLPHCPLAEEFPSFRHTARLLTVQIIGAVKHLLLSRHGTNTLLERAMTCACFDAGTNSFIINRASSQHFDQCFTPFLRAVPTSAPIHISLPVSTQSNKRSKMALNAGELAFTLEYAKDLKDKCVLF